MIRIFKTLLFIALIGTTIFFANPYLFDKLANRTLLSPPYQVSEQAIRLHKNLQVADLHSDSLMSYRDLLETSTIGHMDIPRMIQGNVAIQAFTTVSKSNFSTDLHHVPTKGTDIITAKFIAQFWPKRTWDSLYQRTLFQAKKFDGFVSTSQGTLVAIKTKEDLERYLLSRETNQHQTAGFLGVEGLHALEGNIENINTLYDAGFRMMAPTHFFDNKLGGSAHGINKGGLTPFGIEAIKKMEAKNIILDISHASPKMIDDILNIAKNPIIISHTGVKGTCDNPRNVSDKHLLAVAKTGGVIGIAFFDMAICGTTLEHIVKAIRHTVELAGIDHVALGSDFDGAVTTSIDSSGFILITDALLKDGFTEEEVTKIMGGNTIRVLLESLPSEQPTG